MNLIDQILNLAALLLWLSWRSSGFLLRAGSSILSLASTKRAEPRRTPPAFYLISLLGY